MPQRRLPETDILAAFDDGERNCAELARRFGGNSSSIIGLLRRNGRVTRSHKAPSRLRLVGKVLDHARAGLTARQIAKNVGLTRNAVIGICWRRHISIGVKIERCSAPRCPHEP